MSIFPNIIAARYSPRADWAFSVGTRATAAPKTNSSSSIALVDIAVGMRWLRDVAGVETIVLLGNSGGGSLMAAYQAEAIKPTLAETASGPLREALAALPQGQLYISLNAHPGRRKC